MKELFNVQGLDINVRNQEGNTPLSNACHAGYAEVVRTLARATDADGNRMNLDVNAQNRSGYTPLYLAAYAGHAAVVAELLHLPGIDVNVRVRYGQTALLATARRGHAEAARALLKSKEISDAVDEIVLPGLLEACKFKRFNVVAAILTAPELAGHRDYLSEELMKFSLQVKELNAQKAD